MGHWISWTLLAVMVGIFLFALGYRRGWAVERRRWQETLASDCTSFGGCLLRPADKAPPLSEILRPEDWPEIKR